jgi:malate synthase
MEDAATAEISRAELWQWLHHEAKLDDGRVFTHELYLQIKKEELSKLPSSATLDEAEKLFDQLVISPEFLDFLTLPAYPKLLELTDSFSSSDLAPTQALAGENS